MLMNRPLMRTLFALTALAGMTAYAAAADLTAGVDAAPQPQKTEKLTKSPWQVRLRALGVVTRDSGHVNGVAGSGLSYSDTVVPELDFSYFFTPNIAAELILGTSYANINGTGSISSLGKVGKTWFLPPSLTLQYHFTNFGKFQPYVGAGINYTMFYNQKAGSADSLKVKNTWGPVLQVGADYMINDHWGINFDVKKIFLRPDFDVTVGGNKLSGKAKLDPWLIGTGVTYRF